jgi:hypothetical protein
VSSIEQGKKQMQRFSRWHFRFLSVAALVLSSWSTSGEAAVPTGLTQQGRVLDADGNPVTSEVAMTFTIYDDPEAAEEKNILWTEVLNIQLDDGYFSARIGEDGDNPFPADLFDGSVRYLGVTVGSDEEMKPRARLASVPYAFIAGDAIGAIHPLSVTVNGKKVIDEKGDWVGNAVDRPMSSLLSIAVGTQVSTTNTVSATVTCPANSFVTGGGCTAMSNQGPDSDFPASVKESYPSIVNGAPAANRWNCKCYSYRTSNASYVSCDTTAYAICAKN